ncbi:DUF7002 family protein [Bradyrhizobium cenepequi]|uniref:DUF7002 family protein n=1 Tax=Bradyrhizobium cenepequi TaxID=2821403 RepID=UPI001CE28D71|nr:hypothetical protein [Bradyrhizobium cenepequi]MCA6108973.1 hypothetical protein [Bradyrhizobium cenepequi]
MTDAELEELIDDCPTLYHMAERGSWLSIEKYGLLSTTALLDQYEISGEARDVIEAERRSNSVALQKEGIGRAIVRDQFPMDGKGLVRCLQDGLQPQDWYRLLNSKVFFWLTRSRLLRLLNAGNYRNEEHDVLQLDAAPLIGTYKEKIWFCPINSGCTKPFPHPRGKTTFSRIPDYPYAMWKERRRPRGERVVELAVDYSVPDVKSFVKRVVRMKGNDELQTLWEK